MNLYDITSELLLNKGVLQDLALLCEILTNRLVSIGGCPFVSFASSNVLPINRTSIVICIWIKLNKYYYKFTTVYYF